MLNRYKIIDNQDRTWGTFTVSRIDNDNIHGYLEATDIYIQSIHPIFIEHENTFLDPQDNTDKTIKKIIQLGAYLIDESTDKEIDIDKIIFINQNYLVTCKNPGILELKKS